MLIKIISGTYGYMNGGRICPKTPNDEPFEEDDERAKELIEDGIAIAVVSENQETAKPVQTSSQQDEPSGSDIPTYSEKTKNEDLQKIMDDYDIEPTYGTTKKQLLQAIDEFFHDDKENDDQPPEISAADPV